MKLNFLL